MTTIDLNPLFVQVVWPFLGVVATAVASVIAYKVNKWLGLKENTINQDLIEVALKNALQAAQAKVATSDIANIKVQSRIIADAGNYVVRHVPDTLLALGVDVTTVAGQQELAEKIGSRLAPAVLVGTDRNMTVGAAATLVNPAVPTAPAESKIVPADKP